MSASSSCPQCKNEFNLNDIVPVLQLCQHTACYKCISEQFKLINKSICSECKDQSEIEPVLLQKNQTIINQLLEKAKVVRLVKTQFQALIQIKEQYEELLREFSQAESEIIEQNLQEAQVALNNKTQSSIQEIVKIINEVEEKIEILFNIMSNEELIKTTTLTQEDVLIHANVENFKEKQQSVQQTIQRFKNIKIPARQAFAEFFNMILEGQNSQILNQNFGFQQSTNEQLQISQEESKRLIQQKDSENEILKSKIIEYQQKAQILENEMAIKEDQLNSLKYQNEEILRKNQRQKEEIQTYEELIKHQQLYEDPYFQKQEQQKQKSPQLKSQQQTQICQVKYNATCEIESNSSCVKCERRGCLSCMPFKQRCDTCNKNGYYCLHCYNNCKAAGHIQ